jgi:hypothetical protein
MHQIRWPDGIDPPPFGETLAANVKLAALNSTCGEEWIGKMDSGMAKEIEAALQCSTPREAHQNHGYVFTLARAVKAMEKKQARLWSHGEKRKLFHLWLERAAPHLKKSQNVDEYWFEFLEAYDNAIYVLGFDVIQNAWKSTNSKDPPAAANQFQSDKIRLLVSLCRELQILSGEKAFFLSCRTVQRLFNLESHARAAAWLKGLTQDGILKVIKQGGPDTNKATRYRYLPPL